MGYQGADWIERSCHTTLSPIGRATADLLGDVFLGIYHLGISRLRKVDWTDDWCTVYMHDRSMSSVDSDELTRLLLLAHDRMIRVDIRAVAPRCMEIMFHQRHTRDRKLGISQWYPTMETHIAELRAHYEREGVHYEQ